MRSNAILLTGCIFSAALLVSVSAAILISNHRADDAASRDMAQAAHAGECLMAAGEALNTIGTLSDPDARTAVAYVFEQSRRDCGGVLRRIVSDESVFERLDGFAAKVHAFAKSETTL